MKKWIALPLSLILLASPAFAETLTNESVVSLAEAGLGDDVIIAKIKSADASFDLSTTALTGLKAKGVSSPVIAAMIELNSAREQAVESIDSPDPLVPHPIGLYMLDEAATPPKMMKIDASGSSQMKVGNTLGYAFSGGIAPITMKVSLNGETAHVASSTHQPVFFMFAIQSRQGQGAYDPYALLANAPFLSMSSPNEFSLVRLTPKSGHREAKIGNYSLTGAKTGVMDRDRVEFRYETIKNGVFKVTLAAPMSPGEYAFVKGAGVASSVFDFSVR